MSVVAVLVLCSAAMVGSVKVADMDQGSEFTQCVSITDLETKAIDDDITLIDRVGDCCPEGSVPGVELDGDAATVQIVCGLKDDGSVAFSTGTSNDPYSTGTITTCTYNKCYVMKQNIPCKDGTKQRLNGCCGTKPQTNFDAQCGSMMLLKFNAYSEEVWFCATFDKGFITKGNSGTVAKTDDVADGTLQVDKLNVYTPCPGSMVGGGGATTTTTTRKTTTTTTTAPTTMAPTTSAPTTMAPTTVAPTTMGPTTAPPASDISSTVPFAVPVFALVCFGVAFDHLD